MDHGPPPTGGVELITSAAQYSADTISSTQRDFLSRLCEITAVALHAEQSDILLWSPRDRAYATVAQYHRNGLGTAAPPERMLSSMMTTEFLGKLREQGVLSSWTAFAQQPTAFREEIYMALHTHDGLLGVQVAAGFGSSGAGQAILLAPQVAAAAAAALPTMAKLGELERDNGVKSDVIAVAAHELRDVMQTLVVSQTLLLKGAGLSEEQDHQARRIGQGVSQLLDLVERLLELARAEVKHLALDIESVSLAEFVAELTSEVASQPEPNLNVEIGWYIADDVASVRTDRGKLRIILKNLLRNALKFTAAGSVHVRVSARDGGVAIDVADTGTGIDAETRRVMFEPFRRGNNAGVRASGSGLGLYIVHRFLDMLGGHVNVKSSPGNGTTVRVWLPMETPPR